VNAPHPAASRIVGAARACLGARFRPQGRTPAHGLDCAGVALHAGRAAGCAVPESPAYRLDGDGLGARLAAGLGAAGFAPRPGRIGFPGDLLVVEVAPGRPHLAVLTETGAVHAHAGLRRVVEGPLDPAWRRLGAFRFPDTE
jgi:lipoprotein Spr